MKIRDAAAAAGAALYLTGARTGVAKTVREAVPPPEGWDWAAPLDAVLERLEDGYLADAATAEAGGL